MSPGVFARTVWTAFIAALVALGGAAPSQAAADGWPLAHFDKRVNSPQKSVRPGQRAALDVLRQRVADASVDFDPIIGAPQWVRANGSLLTRANGEGGAVPKETASRFDQDADKALKGFLLEHRALFRHGPEILEGAVRKRDYTGAHGIRTAAWEQQVAGIPVFDSVLVAHTTGQGELISVSSLFVPEPEQAADRGTPNRAAKALAPTIGAEQALRLAAKNLGEEIVAATGVEGGPAAKTLGQRFRLKPLPGEASASLVWFPLDGDTLRLCWRVELNRREFGERFLLLVDAESGEILLRRKLTVEVSEVLYRVFTSDSPSPLSPSLPFPTNTQPSLVPRQFLAISNLNAVASPLGWISDEVMETRGNNVDAHLDRDGDDRPDLPRPQASRDSNHRRVFDFPLDLNQHPTNYANASVVQLFYWCNFMHDKLYELGFTESAGNFQKDNFGRGGAGSDAMLADAQDGGGFNNANFTPAPDGSPGKIQMYLFSGPNPPRDGDLDAEVICHEYTHGLTDRMVGGGVGLDFFGHPQSGGLGEGWSDFYALALLSRFGDDPGANYAVGGYVTYQFSGLTQNYYYGIRRYPYSTNLGVDPLTFKDIDPEAASAHLGVLRNPLITSGAGEVHRQGEVWCSLLWDLRALLFAKWGATNEPQFASNTVRALNYVTTGVQLAPPNPSFLQARDALLEAVRRIGDSDTNEVWRAFARRGLGRGAVCPDSSGTIGVLESYDTPDLLEFDVLPKGTQITFNGPLGGPFAPGAFTNVLINSSASNVSWAAGVTVPWLSLSSGSGLIPPNGMMENVLSVSAAGALLPAGTYGGNVYFTNLARSQIVARTIALYVDAPPTDPMVVTPTDPFYVQWPPPSGLFSPSGRGYTVSSSGAASFGWRAFATNNWLSIAPTSGLLEGNAASADVLVTVNSDANALAAGNYVGAVTFLNTNSGARIDALIYLRVGGTDYFTEDFTVRLFNSLRLFDLQNRTLTFTRNEASSNFYSLCSRPATNFPFDPALATPIALTDDQYRQIALTNGQQVSIYGISSNAIYIGANGNLTFDPGLNTNAFYGALGLNEFFDHTRVAPLYADLNPEVGGTVSWMQLEDRLVVTWQDVPEFGAPDNLNSAQVEMWFNGVLRMTWLNVNIANPADPVLYSGLSRGRGLPADFTSSDLSAHGPCVPFMIMVPPRGTEGESVFGLLVSGSVLTNDLVVALSSSDSNEAIVPNILVIPAGHAAAQFEIILHDDLVADGTQPATITATLPDQSSVNATILVDDFESGSLLVSVPRDGREGDALAGGGTVMTFAPVVRPLTVSLAAYDPARVRVPLSVVIPAGQSSAHFDLVLVDNNVIEGTNSVDIEASVPNWVGDIDAIRVSDNESRALRMTLPEQVTEGAGTVFNAGRILLSGVVPTNLVFTLESADTNLVSVPAFITNAAFETNIFFNVTIGNNSVTNGFDSVRVMANAPGFITATGMLRIIDDERPFEAADPWPAHLSAHVPRDVTFSWSINAHAPSTTIYDVYLGASPDLSHSTPIASTTNRTAAPPWQLDPEATYYWQVVARLAPFPPVAGPVWQFTTATLGFQIEPLSSPQFINEPFPLGVTARDEFGLTVTNYHGSMTLTNSAAVPNDSSIVIAEIDSAGFRTVEFVNVSARPVNVTGWQIYYYDAVGWPAPGVVFTIPAPSLCPPGDLFTTRSFPSFFPGTYPTFALASNVFWNNNTEGNPIAVLLRDNFGNIVDFVCASDADPALITVPQRIPPGKWMGAPIAANPSSALTYQRVGNRDLNSSNDWQVLPRSTRTNNIGLLVPFTNTIAAAFSATTLNSFINGTATSSVTVPGSATGLRFGVADGQGRGAMANPIDVIARNDIAVSVRAPESALVNDGIAYQVIVTNTGPLAAINVRLVDTLFSGVFVSALPSQGVCGISNGTVLCALGTVPAAAAATVNLVGLTGNRGSVTNLATVSRADTDGDPGNNSAAAVTAASYPQLIVFDTTNAEPTVAAPMTFALQLPGPYSQTCSVAFATSDGTATAGLDYVPVSGVLVFPPGTTNQSVSVIINPDSLSESNETFFLNLFNPTNLDLTRLAAVGTIENNDSSPLISILDETIVEGDSGTASAVFSVGLSAPSGRIVTAGYSTASATALAGFDYVEVYGVLVFQPGVTNLAIAVPILGDTIPEPTKTFFVTLANVLNARLDRSLAVGTILDNDIAPLDHFTFGPVVATNYAGVPRMVTITARDGNGAVGTNFNEAVSLLAIGNAHSATIASNAIDWALPLGTSFHDARLQSIYLASEIGGAGRIVGLSLEVTTPPAQTLSNFTIRLRHTARSSYATGAWEDQGWTTNYQQDVTVVTNGWVHFAFPQPFDFDGRSNLMLDFSFDNASFTADGLCRSTATPFSRSLYLRTDSAFGRPLDWRGLDPAGTLLARIPNVRLLLGNAVCANITGTNFVNGVWTGAVNVCSDSPNILLRAVDQAGHFGDSALFTALALKIASVARAGNEVTFRFDTLNGSRYVVETSLAANGPWAPLSAVLAGDGTSIQFKDSLARAQFYRVRLVLP